MLPNDSFFGTSSCVEYEGRKYCRHYKIEQQGKTRIVIRVVSTNSPYKQAIAIYFSDIPKFKGNLIINEQKYSPTKKYDIKVLPIEFFPDTQELTMSLEIESGFLAISTASDFLDDYPELIAMVSARTGRTREQFRGVTYTSGFTAANHYGNAFWIEEISHNSYRLHCNDHKMDDDFDDLVLDMEIITCE